MQSPLPVGDSRAVVFATTANGLRLPVIDVTHPAFALADDPASLAARRDAFLAWDRRNRRVPMIVTRLLMRLAARRSPLIRKILASDRDYLDSITTYIFKLGADHLPPGFDSSVDRKLAAAPHVTLVRLRMQQIAGLLAEALRAPLAAAADAPLHLVNIAGGPALDSINALIMLARTHATLLRRPITIEARLYLNGQYQTLVEEQAIVQGGPDDPDLAAAVTRATQNLLGPSGAYRAIDNGHASRAR